MGEQPSFRVETFARDAFVNLVARVSTVPLASSEEGRKATVKRALMSGMDVVRVYPSCKDMVAAQLTQLHEVNPPLAGRVLKYLRAAREISRLHHLSR